MFSVHKPPEESSTDAAGQQAGSSRETSFPEVVVSCMLSEQCVSAVNHDLTLTSSDSRRGEILQVLGTPRTGRRDQRP